MQKLHVADRTWARLLAVRNGDELPTCLPRNPATALYGPIAMARSSFVMAQVGQSLDGRVATPDGDARDISGPEGITHLHRCRALVDAVIVGVGTVQNDDPRLSVREVDGPSPVRVVIDCQARLTGQEKLFHDGGAPVIIIQQHGAPSRRYNADIVKLYRGPNGIAPAQILDVLESRGLRRILVEGGARTIARFIDADLLDRLHVSITPMIIGSGPMGISLPPISQLSSAYRPAAEVYLLGKDVLFDCSLRSQSAFEKSKNIGMTDSADAAAFAYL